MYLDEPYNMLEIGSVHTVSAKLGKDLIDKNYADLIVEPAPEPAPAPAKRRKRDNAKSQ